MAEDDKKIGGIKRAGDTKGIERTQGVSEVTQVKKTEAIKGAGAINSDKRRATRVMTLAEREEFFKMIDEEAHKMFGNSEFSEEHKQVVKEAVRMVVDAASIDDEES